MCLKCRITAREAEGTWHSWQQSFVASGKLKEKKLIRHIVFHVCGLFRCPPVMGAIHRDEPLCSGLKLSGYCHHKVGAGQIPGDGVGGDGDRLWEEKRREKGKKKQGTNIHKKHNKENKWVQVRTRDTVWVEWSRPWGGGGGDGGGAASEELNSKTPLFPDKLLNIFCIKRVWRTQSLLTAV